MLLDVQKIRQEHKSVASKIIGNVVTTTDYFEAFNSVHRDAYSNKLVLASHGNFQERLLDVDWLKGASETYNISADINDYVIVPVPLVTADFPNRNLQAFPFEEISFFDPLLGCFVYKSFIGKPTHIDHQNTDPLKAKGVNFDTLLVPVPKYNTWKIVVLSGFDRTKDAALANDILKKKRNSYSMGALVNYYVCSVCSAIDEGPQGTQCIHMKRGKGSVWSPDNRLSYQMCVGVNFIENSSVEEPADVTASSDNLYTLG